jgi:hypothetical protein
VIPAADASHGIASILAAFGEVVEMDLDAVEETAERLRKYGPDGIITYSEQLQRVTAHLAGLLELRYHTRQMAELLTDKWQQRAALREAGVDSVRTALIHTEADWAAAAAHVGFPAGAEARPRVRQRQYLPRPGRGHWARPPALGAGAGPAGADPGWRPGAGGVPGGPPDRAVR